MRKHFEISYCPLTISLIALQRAELPPYLGSTLRGALGQALLQTDKKPAHSYIGTAKKRTGIWEMLLLSPI